MLQRLAGTGDFEAEVVKHRPLARTSRRLLPEQDQHPGAPSRPAAPLSSRGTRAEVFPPEFHLDLDILDVQMDMPYRHACFVRRRELSLRPSQEGPHDQCHHKRLHG